MTLRITLIIVLFATAASTATSTLVGFWKIENWRNYMTATIYGYEDKINDLKKELNEATTTNDDCQILLIDALKELKEISNWCPEPNKPIECRN